MIKGFIFTMSFPPNFKITKMLLQTLCSTLELCPNLNKRWTSPCRCYLPLKCMHMHKAIISCIAINSKFCPNLYRRWTSTWRLGQSSRVEHKVCNNIFVILRLGGKLIVKINPFIIYILSLIHCQISTLY